MPAGHPNRPHFHAWVEARTGRIFYRVGHGFHTSQAARQWTRRRYDDREVFVRACTRERCKPRLD